MKWFQVVRSVAMTASWRLTVGLAIVGLLLSGSARADLRHYVSPGGSIQAAIAAAENGDIVIVYAGTYNERINFTGKAITVRSSDITDPAVVASTIIDGGAGGPVVTFWSGEGNSSALLGLTIRNGYSNTGGGIYCTNASSPRIERNTISSNGGYYGAGICCTNGSAPTIRSNTISGNEADVHGGGICSHQCSPTIEGNTISDNEADGSGGGIACLVTSSPLIKGNSISGNASGEDGGGIYCQGSSPAIEQNTISGNTALSYGGGIVCSNISSPTIQGNTISGNTASSSGGGIGIYLGSAPTISNSIIAFSTSGGGIGIINGGAAPAMSYCDVYGNTGGNYLGMADPTGANGNISADPLFANAAAGDFHLKSTGGRWDPGTASWVIDAVHSPCVDAGDPASPFANEPLPNGGRANMGAFGNTVQASLTRAPAPTVSIGAPADGASVTCCRIQAVGTAEDDVAVMCVRVRVNGGAWCDATGTGSWAAWVTVQPGPNLIEARARDNAGLWGPLAAVTVNGAADLKPVALFSAPAPNATVATAQVVATGTATDDRGVNKVVVRVNGGTWCDAVGAASWSACVRMQTGANLIEARARDSAGQWGPLAAVTVNGAADLKPVALITAPAPDAAVATAQVVATGTAIDDRTVSKVVVRVNGGTWCDAAGAANWSACVSVHTGANLIEARARDSAGQWGPVAAVTVNGAADLKPVAFFTAPAPNATIATAQVAVTGTASDDGGVDRVLVRVNGGAWVGATGTGTWWAMVGVTAGPMLLECRARDDAGQWGPIAPLSVTGASGDLRPVVVIDAPATASSAQIEISGTACDDVALSRVTVRVNGGTWFTATGTATWSAAVSLVAGSNLVEARARDNAGQWGPIAGATITCTIGGWSLVTGLVAQPSVVGAQLSFSLTAAGAVTAEVLNIAGRPIRTIVSDRQMPAGVNSLLWDGRSSAGLSMPNGTYLIRLTTRSDSGAQAQAMATLRVNR